MKTYNRSPEFLNSMKDTFNKNNSGLIFFTGISGIGKTETIKTLKDDLDENVDLHHIKTKADLDSFMVEQEQLKEQNNSKGKKVIVVLDEVYRIKPSIETLEHLVSTYIVIAVTQEKESEFNSIYRNLPTDNSNELLEDILTKSVIAVMLVKALYDGKQEVEIFIPKAGESLFLKNNNGFSFNESACEKGFVA